MSNVDYGEVEGGPVALFQFSAGTSTTMQWPSGSRYLASRILFNCMVYADSRDWLLVSFGRATIDSKYGLYGPTDLSS